MLRLFYLSIFLLYSYFGFTQSGHIYGVISESDKPLPGVSVNIHETKFTALSDSLGRFEFSAIQFGVYTFLISKTGYYPQKLIITVQNANQVIPPITLLPHIHTLNEMIYTGAGGQTTVKENPFSVNSIRGNKIENPSGNNIIDAIANKVPGLHTVKTGPNISKPFIRGLGYNRVLVLYDGIRQEGQQWGDEHGVEIDPYQIERVEVIKGPASLMYGSDAVAGIVSIIPLSSYKNDKKIHGKYASEYNTNQNLWGNGILLGYGRNQFYISMSASQRMAKNYRNSLDGRVYLTGFSEWNGTVRMGYSWRNLKTDWVYTIYNNMQGIPDGSRDSITGKFTKQMYEGSKDSIFKRPLVTQKELNSYRLPALSQHILHQRVYIKSSYQVKNGKWLTHLALQKNNRIEYTHPLYPAWPGMNLTLQTLNYNLKYIHKEVKNLEFSTGMQGMFQWNRHGKATEFPVPEYNLSESGIYIHLKKKYKKNIFSGGIRYDLRWIRWFDFYLKNDSLTGFNVPVLNTDTVNASKTFNNHTRLFNGISSSIGWVRSWGKYMTLKANVGNSFRAPNITELASNGLDPGAHIIYLGNATFNPEISWQQELGFLFRNPNFSMDMAIYNNIIYNYIFQALEVNQNGTPRIDAQGNKTYLYQQALAWLWGGETWISVHPKNLKGWVFETSMSFTQGYNRNFKGKKTQGEYLPLIPPARWQGLISKKITLKKSENNLLNLELSFDYWAAQHRFLALNNSETYTPSYLLLNAAFNYEFKMKNDKSCLIYLTGENLTNINYQSHLSRLKYFNYSQNNTIPNGIFNMGRNWAIKLLYKF